MDLTFVVDVNLTCRLMFYSVKADALASTEDNMSKLSKVKSLKRTENFWEFETVQACAALGMTPSELSSYFYSLQAKKKLNVQWEDEAFHYELLADGSLDFASVWQNVTTRVKQVESSNAKKVESVFALMNAFAMSSFRDCFDSKKQPLMSQNRQEMAQCITEYFDEEASPLLEDLIKKNDVVTKHQAVKQLIVKNDVERFVSQHMDAHTLTGRMVARIFHAIPSPAYPHVEWSRNDFWGRHMDFDFNALCQIATKVIMGEESEEEDDE